MAAFGLLSRSTSINKRTRPSLLENDEPRPNGSTNKRKRDDEPVYEPSKRRSDAYDSHEKSDAQLSSTYNRVLKEDDCRRLLRSNKIRVTKLWSHGDYNISEDCPTLSRPSKGKNSSTRENGSRKKPKLDILPQPLTAFSQLRSRYGLPTTLLINLDAQGYSSPTEVQLGSLPLLLRNGADGENTARHMPLPGPSLLCPLPANLLTVAPTGSGKTLAFLLPMINALIQRRREKASHPPDENGKRHFAGPLAVVLAPTKELVRQIVNEGRKLVLKTGIRISAVQKSTVLHGHEDHDSADSENDEDDNDIKGRRKSKPAMTKSHILVSTPSAILAAAKRPQDGVVDLSTVTNLVLDEADVLLDPLFRDQTMGVWDACTYNALRISLWSATMGSNIEELTLAKAKARRESGLDVVSCPLYRLVVGLKDSSIPNIEHRLVYAATEQGKLMGVRQMLHTPEAASRGGPIVRPPFLVFTQTIQRAIALHSELLYDIPPEADNQSRIAVLHSDLSDTIRDKVMTQLRKGELWMLITTDLLARGVDFKGINGVINYDLPNTSAAYVHRVGRTGRAGREGGVAITFYSKDDMPYVKNVANVIAASERQKGEASASTRQWLLDSLPKVSKQDKLKLKRRGVESRRSRRVEDGTRRSTRTTISTKSGYERQLESRRRGARVKNQSGRNVETHRLIDAAEDEVDFSGFDD